MNILASQILNKYKDFFPIPVINSTRVPQSLIICWWCYCLNISFTVLSNQSSVLNVWLCSRALGSFIPYTQASHEFDLVQDFKQSEDEGKEKCSVNFSESFKNVITIILRCYH